MRVSSTLFKPVTEATAATATTTKQPCASGKQVAGLEVIVESPQEMSRTERTRQPSVDDSQQQIRPYRDIESPGEKVCIICCSRLADAVLLPCNHGGVCFDCGSRMAQQKATCHFCRQVPSLYAITV